VCCFFSVFNCQVYHKETTMSPALAVGAGSAAKDVKRESATARLLGSGKDNRTDG
jgi:hypothetical protein